MSAVKISASSLQEALQKAKKEYGSDALIEEATTDGGKVSITVIPSKRQNKPVTTSDVLNKKGESSSVSLIRSIHNLCEYHLLDYEFCGLWLQYLELELAKQNNDKTLLLANSLEKCVPFNAEWLDSITKDTIIALIGPNGAGKTSVMAKMAVMLMSVDHDIQVVNLDTVKAGAVEQVNTYMQAIDKVAIHGSVGWKNCLKQRDKDSIILLDTPGINGKNERELNELDNLLSLSSKSSQYSPVKFVLVLPAFLNGPTAKEIVKNFSTFNPEALIVTYMDQVNCLGSFIHAAHLSQYPLALFSQSPKIADELHPLSSQALVKLMVE